MISIDLVKPLHTSSGILDLEVSLQLEAHQRLAIYGESGVGKTSILRMVAGLLKPARGKIVVNNSVWFDSAKGVDIKPQNRNVGFVFQDYALFPTMSVRRNLLFAAGKQSTPAIIDELIDVMKLTELQNKYPETLSGGQKQRVALARALVQKPEILLLDEPFSAIDRNQREIIQSFLRERFKETTLILVTHDVGEIHKLADRVCVIKDGKVTMAGTPPEVFSRQLSAKFSFTGTVLEIAQEDVLYVVTVLIGAQSVRVVAHDNEVADLHVGDEVIVASKAFNPVIQKVLKH